MRSTRIVLVVIAIALGLGLSLYARNARATTSSGSCYEACDTACGTCAGASGDGCTCNWFCSDGTRGRSICL